MHANGQTPRSVWPLLPIPGELSYDTRIRNWNRTYVKWIVLLFHLLVHLQHHFPELELEL